MNVGVGDRHCQAHLFGSFNIQLQEDEYLLSLLGTETHVHLDWTLVQQAKRENRYGWDSIALYKGEQRLLAIWPEEESYRFPIAVLHALEKLHNSLAIDPT